MPETKIKKPKVVFRLAKVNSLVTADWNYKEEDEDMEKNLINNLEKNGFVQNLVVRKLGDKYEVVDGNHRLTAMQKMGVEEIMVCDVGEISDHDAYMLSLSLNETKFENNEWALANLVKELSSTYSLEQLDLYLPFQRDNIESMIETAEIDWESLENHQKEVEDGDTGYHTIMVQVKEEVNEQWLAWCERVKTNTDSTSKALAFEYAIVEAINTKTDE